MDGAHACVDRDARKFLVLLKLDPGVADPEAWVCLHPVKMNAQFDTEAKKAGIYPDSIFDQYQNTLLYSFCIVLREDFLYSLVTCHVMKTCDPTLKPIHPHSTHRHRQRCSLEKGKQVKLGLAATKQQLSTKGKND